MVGEKAGCAKDGTLRNGAVERRGREAVFLGAVFAAIVVWLLWCVWPLATLAAHETGDTAANSVLIQSAKHLRLTLGNYSRVGFNHPGPAILYVLAAGEAFFSDRLRLTSPVGGQVLAVAIYNAIWITGAVFSFRQIGLARSTSVLAISAACLWLAVAHGDVFASMWFPDLYVTPFLCFTLSLAAWLSGARSTLPLLAAATGTLINGHVSFVGICGMALLGAVIWKIAVQRAWLLLADRHSFAAALLGSVFLAPLVIREISHRPGPIEQYFAFSRGNAAHRIDDVMRFVADIWAPSALLAAATVAGFLIIFAKRESQIGKSLLIAFANAATGTVFYAMRGVDDFQFSYVILFSITVPALAFGSGLALWTETLARWRRLAVMVIGIAICSSTLTMIVRPVLNVEEFNNPAVAELDAALRSASSGPTAIDLNAFMQWPLLVGVEALRLRQDGALGFCIARGWHILFTEAARCPVDLAGWQRVRLDLVGDPIPGPPVAMAAGIALRRE